MNAATQEVLKKLTAADSAWRQWHGDMDEDDIEQAAVLDGRAEMAAGIASAAGGVPFRITRSLDAMRAAILSCQLPGATAVR